MDNEEFLRRLGNITEGLEDLADDLYNAAESGVPNNKRADVMSRARTRLKEYDEFLPILSEGRRETATKRCRRNITSIRSRLESLEKLA